jgi:hypothetical protein
MDNARWRGMSLEARYQHLHGTPQPEAEPVAAVAVSIPMRGPLTDEDRSAIRRVEARRELDAALRQEAEETARVRRVTLEGTAIGQLLGGNHGRR